MKKVTLLETYLSEKDGDADFRGKVNKELGSFKSLLNGGSKDEPAKPEVAGVNKELGKAKWELSEDMGEPGRYDIFDQDRLIGQSNSLKGAMQQVKGLPANDLEVKRNGEVIGHIDSTGNFVHSLEERHANLPSNPLFDTDEGFGLTPENPFDDAVENHHQNVQNNKFNTKPEDAFSDAFNSSVKEAVIGVDQMDPMDELEHVSLVIHPTVSTPGMDPLMTPMGGCDSEDASVSTFAAPGGPDFEQSGTGDKTVLVDGELKQEAAWTFSPDDVGFDDHVGGGGLYDEEPLDDMDDDDGWLSYLLEPEEEKHNLHSNDMKGSVGTQGTQSTAVTTPTKPTVPTKENCDGMMKMKENVERLKAHLSEARKSVAKPEQIAENINKLKASLKNLK